MATREEKLDQLVGLFGSEDLTRSVLANVLDSNKEVVEDAVDELLTMTKDVTGRAMPTETKDAPKDVRPPLALLRLPLAPFAPLALSLFIRLAVSAIRRGRWWSCDHRCPLLSILN